MVMVEVHHEILKTDMHELELNVGRLSNQQAL